MATLNLGRIKPVFRGAWTNGAYVIDDIVTHGNESFICIQAGSNIATSNASYWTKLAAKGADGSNGTDLTSTLTTQGDIVYRDGSGLQRLAAGTSGQVLQTGGSGANPSWANASSGKILAYYFDSDYTNRTTTSTSYDLHGSTISIQLTPASSASKFYMIMTFQGGNNMSARRSLYKFHRDGSALNNSQMEHEFIDGYSNENPSAMSYIDSPNTTSQITYDVRWRANGSSDTAKLCMQTLMIFELGA
jgi:hypothetical protein